MQEHTYDEVAKHLCIGTPERRIAELLNVSRGAVEHYKRKIYAHWRENAQEAIDAALQQSLHRLQHIYLTAWEAYEESKREAVSTSTFTAMIQGKDGKEREERATVTRDKPATGNPVFLNTALQAIDRINSIYGLEAARKIANADGSPVQAANVEVVLYVPANERQTNEPPSPQPASAG
jgi:predicted transcriptional regulator